MPLKGTSSAFSKQSPSRRHLRNELVRLVSCLISQYRLVKAQVHAGSSVTRSHNTVRPGACSVPVARGTPCPCLRSASGGHGRFGHHGPCEPPRHSHLAAAVFGLDRIRMTPAPRLRCFICTTGITGHEGRRCESRADWQMTDDGQSSPGAGQLWMAKLEGTARSR